MSFIFAISPGYLDALYECSEDFEFKLQGYGNTESASRGTMYTNVQQIIGFIYMDNRLPKDLKGLDTLLWKCNLMCSASRRSFIFAIKDHKQLRKLELPKYSNLDFEFVEIETVTNVLIRRDLFGTLLLTRYEPYILEETNEVMPDVDCPVLNYEPLFPIAVYKVMSPIQNAGEYRYVRFVDQVLADLSDSSEILAMLRDIRIMYSCNQSYAESLAEVKAKIDDVDNSSMYCTYIALYRVICEEVGFYDCK